MKKTLALVFFFCSATAFAQATLENQCKRLAAIGTSKDIVCNLEMSEFMNSQTDTEINAGLKKIQECKKNFAKLCVNNYDTNEDVIVNGAYFSSKAFTQELACSIELRNINNAQTHEEKIKALQASSECVGSLTNLYVQEIKL